MVTGYIVSELDLIEYCIHWRHSTYFVMATGNSMTDIGLYSGADGEGGTVVPGRVPVLTAQVGPWSQAEFRC